MPLPTNQETENREGWHHTRMAASPAASPHAAVGPGGASTSRLETTVTDVMAMPTNSRRRMPLVYVAGPYRSADGHAGVQANIEAARRVGIAVVAKGYSVIVPHTNTGNFEQSLPELGDNFWLDATLEQMRRCDAVVLVPGWESSLGTRGEIVEAECCAIPVYGFVEDLPELPAGQLTPPEYIRLLRQGVRRARLDAPQEVPVPDDLPF